MSHHRQYRILVVEDDKAFSTLLGELFVEQNFDCELVLAERLELALKYVHEEAEAFDLILLDLGLPDSSGIETFGTLHEAMKSRKKFGAVPAAPIMVLTGLDDPVVGLRTVQLGAEDYLVKKTTNSIPLARAVQYAIERTHVTRKAEQEHRQGQQDREMESIERLSASPPTTITAQLYSGQSLREVSEEEFTQVVREYGDVLGLRFEERLFKVDHHCDEILEALGNRMGFLKASPRDVLEVHCLALKARTDRVTVEKASLFIEEGRLTVLQLMGYLAACYRNYYTRTPSMVRARKQ